METDQNFYPRNCLMCFQDVLFQQHLNSDVELIIVHFSSLNVFNKFCGLPPKRYIENMISFICLIVTVNFLSSLNVLYIFTTFATTMQKQYFNWFDLMQLYDIQRMIDVRAQCHTPHSSSGCSFLSPFRAVYWLGNDTLRVSADLFAENRRRLCAALKAKDGVLPQSVVVLQGGEQKQRYCTDTDIVFRQVWSLPLISRLKFPIVHQWSREANGNV